MIDWSSDVCSSDLSVSGSTEEVASSRTRSPGSPSWARPRATSCRSPTERLPPRSPTRASRPPGPSSSQPRRTRESKAARDRKSVDKGKGVSERVELGGRQTLNTQKNYEKQH